jgi:hypothetical protein
MKSTKIIKSRKKTSNKTKILQLRMNYHQKNNKKRTIRGHLVDMLVELSPETHTNNIIYKGKSKIIYVLM